MKLLLLAGTAEGRALAEALAPLPRIEVVASLAGATEAPASLPLETRIGAFGGVDGMAAYLEEMRVDAVLDATHPFAAQITANARAAAERMGRPYLRLRRRPWAPEPGDEWVEVADFSAAAALPASGARALLTTGRKSLGAFAAREDVAWLARVVDALGLAAAPKGVDIRVMRPPFSADDELAFFTAEGVEHLIAKNSGGESGRAKLLAARRLRLPVTLVAPPEEPADAVETVAAAVAWAAALAG